jgi:hypothetical protein
MSEKVVMKMVEWMEPFDQEGLYPLKCAILLDHAIAWQHNSAAIENSSYPNDEDALAGFIAARHQCKVFEIIIKEKSKIILAS